VESMTREIEEILKIRPYLGTMNLVSTRPYFLSERYSLKAEGGKKLFWPANVDGCSVYVYRWKHAPLHVFEVIAEVKLRDELGLKDEDVVFINIDDIYFEEVGFFSKVVWYVIWWRRAEWSYKKDGYYEITRPWAKFLGATQLNKKEYSVKDLIKESISILVRFLSFGGGE